MALFVAKLFADTSPVVREPEPVAVSHTEEVDRESPPLVSVARKSVRISRQALGKKLVRMYTKNSQRQIRENIESGRQKMAGFDPSQRPRMQKADAAFVEFLRMAEPEFVYDSSKMDLGEYVAGSLRAMENVRRQIEAEAEAKKAADERLRIEMESQVEKFFSENKLEKVCENLQQIVLDIPSDVFDTHRENMRKGEFVDGVVRCLQLTNEARRSYGNPEHVANCLQETQNILNRFVLLGLGKSNCYRVLHARFRIVMNEFAGRLVEQLEVPESRVAAYKILKNFQNKKFSIEKKLLDPWLKKFEYHFVRAGSALNEPDKPEWPLKWFLETGRNIREEIDVYEVDSVLVELAKQAREYFDNHRWSLIEDPNEDIFSLYLSKYLEFALQVRDLMGAKAMEECMRGFSQDAAPTKNGWTLLHEWIRHDRRYFETVVDGIKEPWSQSKIDPSVNEIVQTLVDMLSACFSRIEPLAVIPENRREFVSECCDHVIRSYVVHGVRIEIASDVPAEKRPLLVNSLRRLVEKGSATDLVSSQVRKLLSELMNELE